MPPDQSTDFIPDLPSGPLDEFRKQSSFCWKKLKLVFEDAEMLKLKMALLQEQQDTNQRLLTKRALTEHRKTGPKKSNTWFPFHLPGFMCNITELSTAKAFFMKLWQKMESDALYHSPTCTPSVDEQKRRAALRLVRFHTLGFYTEDDLNTNYKRKTRTMMTLNEATSSVSTDLSVKFALGVALFCNSLLSLGTERHLPLYRAAWRGELLSCIALTEVGHGSNTKRMRTTATFDKVHGDFVIHTPDFQAAKCWVGNLGKTCTWALLFAQLITAEEENHGLHAFVIPIRDPKTLLPYPGIILGDMGEKIGLNGIDNGFLIFQQYHVPRESLLNRMSDVTSDGEYETSFSNPEQQLGAALEVLSAGRVGIMQESANTLSQAVTIAVRYSAIRKQFCANGQDTELALIDYPLHQWRLIPYVAATCALKIFITDFTNEYLETVEESNSKSGAKLHQLSLMVAEVHAMVSVCKPLVTWTCRDAIQECREACGGHGYLAASGLGELRNNHDPRVTYEGDNNVLIQQTSNWLLRRWRKPDDVESPLGSAHFLERRTYCLQNKFTGSQVQHVINHTFIRESYEWLLCWLLQETDKRLQKVQSKGENSFTARNEAQVYRARTLALVYGENNTLSYFWSRCHNKDTDVTLQPILEKLYFLYGLWSLDKHLALFYQGGYASGPQLVELLREAILQLCAQLKPEVVSVVDALAPPDFALNSVLGKADGKVYDHLQTAFFHNPGAMERPAWWSQIVNKAHLKCKL